MASLNLQSLLDTPQQGIDTAAKVLLVISLFFMPISTAATNIFMGLTLIAWLLSGGFQTRWHTLRSNWFAWATAGLFLIMCIGSSWSTGSRDDILFQLHKYAKLLFMLPAITLMQEEKWRERGLMAFGAAMLLTLALSLLSVVWPLPFVRGTAGGPSDNHFVFRDHIAQNLMMSFFALLLLVKGRFASSQGIRLLYLALGFLSIIDILFFVHGRTGYVSLAFNAFVFVMFLGNLRQRIIAILGFALIAVAAAQFSSNFNARVNQAVTEYEEQDEKKLSSIGQRVEFFKKGMQLMKERPLFGFGTGSYHKEFCRVADTQEWCLAGGFHPHNQFIAFGVQLGIVGLLTYLLYLAVCLKQALLLAPEARVMAVGLVATLVADSIFHAPLFLIAEAAFFMLLFPIFMAARPDSHEPEARTQR
jgi:O-antigen ligase